jgi:hypothetical protein
LLIKAAFAVIFQPFAPVRDSQLREVLIPVELIGWQLVSERQQLAAVECEPLAAAVALPPAAEPSPLAAAVALSPAVSEPEQLAAVVS